MKQNTAQLALACAALVAALALSGCAGDGNGGTTTPPTTTSPTPSTTTTTTPSTTPTTPVPNTAVVTSVTVTSFNASVPRGGTAIICWRVEGTGTTNHVSVHYDNETHASSQNFRDYDGGAIYPNNETGPSAKALPATFCSGLKAPSTPGTIYFRAHVIAAADQHSLSDEKAITVT